MEVWYPTARQNIAPVELWVPYTGGLRKGVLHTTESTVFSPHSNYYGHNNWPHFTVNLSNYSVWQHIPINWGARALENQPGGVQTNSDGVVQIEITWLAVQAHLIDRRGLDLIATLMRWIENNSGVKRHAPTFKAYPSSYGINNGVRFSNADWDKFDGWCGHQHVPENTHGDPGAINIAYLLNAPIPVGEDELLCLL